MQIDFFIEMGLSIVISLLKGLKGPEKILLFRRVFLKINKLIAGVYGQDTEFKSVWGSSGGSVLDG